MAHLAARLYAAMPDGLGEALTAAAEEALPVFDTAGNLIPGAALDADGNIVDADGNPLDADGNLIGDGDGAAVLDTAGNVIPGAMLDADGNIVDADGNPLDADGNPLDGGVEAGAPVVDEDGNVLDADGNVIDGATVADDGTVVGADGEPLDAAVPVEELVAADGGGGGAGGQFGFPAGACPRDGTPQIPAGKANQNLKVPAGAGDEYDGVAVDGNIKLLFDNIPLGGEYCVNGGSETITVGGTLLFKDGDLCVLPPTQDDGSPCCEIKAWQPNAGGFYYDNCSMTCAPRRSLVCSAVWCLLLSHACSPSR